MDYVEILGLVGSIGSILGFAGTLWAFFQQRALKKRYTLLLRGPELLEALFDHASTINNLSRICQIANKPFYWNFRKRDLLSTIFRVRSANLLDRNYGRWRTSLKSSNLL